MWLEDVLAIALKTFNLRLSRSGLPRKISALRKARSLSGEVLSPRPRSGPVLLPGREIGRAPKRFLMGSAIDHREGRLGNDSPNSAVVPAGAERLARPL